MTRAEIEGWMAPDLARLAAAMDAALVDACVGVKDVDRVFLTCGTSPMLAVRAFHWTVRVG